MSAGPSLLTSEHLHHLRQQVAAAATHGVFIGTSSWKYPGWLGQLYTPERYEYRGKVAKTRFERDCLAEYAETFRTVCVDAGYYAFPKREALERMAAQVPADFLFTFKVTDEITLKRFPNLPRFGPRAGQATPHFLDAELFATVQRHAGAVTRHVKHGKRGLGSRGGWGGLRLAQRWGDELEPAHQREATPQELRRKAGVEGGSGAVFGIVPTQSSGRSSPFID